MTQAVLKKSSKNFLPKDNFYYYVNHEWLEKNSIPASESWWGTFNVLRHDVLNELKQICEEVQKAPAAKKGSVTQLVRDFYSSGMDMEMRNSLGVKPLKEILSRIERIKNTDDLVKVVAQLHTFGFAPFVHVHVDEDAKKPGWNTLYFEQSGLGMPDRDYYLKDDEAMKKIRQKYVIYIDRMFALAGFTAERSNEFADIIMRIEHVLAKASLPAEQVRVVDKNYHAYTLLKAQKAFPFIDWYAYFQTLGIEQVKKFVISQPVFVAAVMELFQTTSLDDLKQYLSWVVLRGAGSLLGEDFVTESFNFYGKVLTGQQELRPLWKRVIATMESSALVYALGPLYVERHFKPEAKERVKRMVEHIRLSFADRIGKLDWMADDTKELALKKLDHIVAKIGYPDVWVDVSGLAIDKKYYAKNGLEACSFEFRRKIKQYDRAVDRSEWVMAPITVNACADLMREITFPAAILQPPFFDFNADEAYNYGAIGSVIGHELTHFFDDQGCKFDSTGRLQNWWTMVDKKHFRLKTKGFIKHYSKYNVDGVPVNARLTLGENIADVGGILIAYGAFKKYLKETQSYKVIDGLTPEQRFFVGYARIWREKMRPEEQKRMTLVDPHSHGEVRTNAACSLVLEFGEVFGVREGDGMYLPPEKRVALW